MYNNLDWIIPKVNAVKKEVAALGESVPLDMGVTHAGEFLVVGDDGNVTTQNLPLYDGSVV